MEHAGEILLYILTTGAELIETTTTDHLEEGKFLADILNTLVPLEAVFIGDVNWRGRLASHPAGGNLGEKFIGDKADDDSNRERDGSKKERDAPLGPVQTGDFKCRPSDEDDHNLSPNHDDVDSDEEPIVGDTFKNVELVVKTTVATKYQKLSHRTEPDETQTYLYWLKICIHTKVLKTKVFMCSLS